jgi:hypothetical protein
MEFSKGSYVEKGKPGCRTTCDDPCVAHPTNRMVLVQCGTARMTHTVRRMRVLISFDLDFPGSLDEDGSHEQCSRADLHDACMYVFFGKKYEHLDCCGGSSYAAHKHETLPLAAAFARGGSERLLPH